MRVLYVWITAITLITIITIGWYIGNAVVATMAGQLGTDLTGSALSTLQLLQYVAAWWGPILDVLVLLWAFLNSKEYGQVYA